MTLRSPVSPFPTWGQEFAAPRAGLWEHGRPVPPRVRADYGSFVNVAAT